MPPCLIAIDMDGTLLGSDGRVSLRNREALRRAEESGVEIVIATGRRHAYAMRLLRELEMPPHNAVVSSNGTVIRTIDARLIQRTHMPLSTARWLCGASAEFRDTLVLTFDTVGEDGEDRLGALVCEQTAVLHDSIGAWMRANEPYIRRVERMEQALGQPLAQGRGTAVVLAEEEDSRNDLDFDASATSAPIQAMLCGTVERMQRAEALLLQHAVIAGVGASALPGTELTLHRTVYPERDLAILDILPAGCSKASALAHLAAMRGCTMKDVLAIGDNWNDLPMLEAAGQTVLMGNAPAELRRLAEDRGWRVGPTHDEDGVAQAIDAALGLRPHIAPQS